MANTTSIDLVSLDFTTLKNSLKTYLKGQAVFQDFDFEGSNINVLLDLLTYNTQLNAFYLNMVASEMFLDSAQLRDSIVSHCKELNYLPRSFRSAEASVNLRITSSSSSTQSVSIPKGTSFSAKVGSNNFTFTTAESLIISNGTSNATASVFVANSVSIFEGTYITDTFVTDYANTSQRFVLGTPTVDTNSLTVTIIENSGANSLNYVTATSLFGVNSSSQVFFIQGAEDSKYEIVFGDNTFGRRPADNSVVVAEYRISSGELPNGAAKFTADGSIDGHANVVVTTVVNSDGSLASASGGSINETISSIKFNAPRYFASQERAITPEDYETLLQSNFPEIQAISVYGGEDHDPPQYGKVFISVDIANADGVPDSKKSVYSSFISSRTALSIDPVFINPEFMYVKIDSSVDYNVRLTSKTSGDIQSLVAQKISNYNTNSLEDFKATLRYSKLVEAIDSADTSIVGNQTDIRAIVKYSPTLNTNTRFTISFNLPMTNTLPPATVEHSVSSLRSLTSSTFTFDDAVCIFEDDAQGNVFVSTLSGSTLTRLKNVGSVDYDTGLVTIGDIIISDYSGNGIKFYAIPRDKNIYSSKNVILKINDEDVTITVNPVRE
jgi:hypothetical protein